MNSSGLSASPLPDAQNQLDPQSIMTRRRSSGTLSQKSKSSKDSKSESESRTIESRVHKLREGHFLSEDIADYDFQGHEVMVGPNMTNQWTDKVPNKNHQQQKQQQIDRGGMHENIIFQSPTNLRYFSPPVHQQAQGFNSRTLPNRKRRDKAPVVFTTGKLSVDCSSASSSSHASPRICRPKSLDFSVVAMQVEWIMGLNGISIVSTRQ